MGKHKTKHGREKWIGGGNTSCACRRRTAQRLRCLLTASLLGKPTLVRRLRKRALRKVKPSLPSPCSGVEVASSMETGSGVNLRPRLPRLPETAELLSSRLPSSIFKASDEPANIPEFSMFPVKGEGLCYFINMTPQQGDGAFHAMLLITWHISHN